MAITNDILSKSVWHMHDKIMFKKGAQNDVITVQESANYIEAHPTEVIKSPIPGVENVNVTVAGKPETWEYESYTMAGKLVDSTTDGRVTIADAVADVRALPLNVFLLNATTGEYIVFVNKNETKKELQAIRGIFGTTKKDVKKDDVMYILNKVKLTSANTGFGMMTFHEMPTPGYSQNQASN